MPLHIFLNVLLCVGQMMEQEAVVGKQEERKHNLQSLHRISVAGFVVRGPLFCVMHS